MDRRIIDLYDAFTHGHLDRRTFVARLARLAGGAAAAAALMPLLVNDYARAAMIEADDPRLAIDKVTYEADGTAISGYLARPKGGEKRPAVVVIHENRGLNPHIQDVARHLAVDGFLALAPDALSSLGGTPADEDQARQMQSGLAPEAALAAYVGAVAYLAAHPESNGKVGAVGFCWGGGMANRLAAAGTALAAAVPYYGSQLSADQVPSVTAPLLLHYAGLDQRINAGIAAHIAALTAAGKPHEVHIYEGANHGFNNDTGSRYDEAAAALAWERTVAFLKRELAG
jgi:carboxymethylenebutenolidase